MWAGSRVGWAGTEVKGTWSHSGKGNRSLWKTQTGMRQIWVALPYTPAVTFGTALHLSEWQYPAVKGR